MARKYSADDDRPARAVGAKPDPDAIVVETLLIPWVARHGALPQPCPYDLYDCARWWRTRMQEPELPGETIQAAVVTGSAGRENGLRWDCGYAVRLRGALLAYLGMNDIQRQSVAQCVLRDGIAYRGEPFAQYMDICEETDKMRANPKRYIRETLDRFGRAKAKLASREAA
jgi:hypothetical protein